MNVFMIIVGILLAVAGIIVPIILQSVENSRSYGSSSRKIAKGKWVAMLIAGVLVFLIGCSFTIIPTGYTGVRTTFGQISQEACPRGLNWKIPFVQSIHTVNNKQQDWKYESQIWGESSERTPVYGAKTTVTYQVNPEKSAWIFANVTDHENLISADIIASAMKSAMKTFTAAEVTSRDKIEPATAEKLQASLNEKYGENTIAIIKVTIDDMDFEESYNAAIAEKSIAMQKQEKQKIENETAIAKAEADKKVAIANAEAKAEATRIAAEAEAEANKKIKESLSDEILESKFYEKWDGKLPNAMGADTIITDISGSDDKE